MSDMRYMDRLDVVVADAVGLIREKTSTYGDSWKRRGGPGAWFTTVRPIDRLEGIMNRHGGDIFAAIEADPTGQDGSALACVRDVMNYLILIEAHARVTLGVGPHGPARPAQFKTIIDARDELGLLKCDQCQGPREAVRTVIDVRFRGKLFCSPRCAETFAETPAPQRPGTPEDGGHHALETAGEVTQDAAGAGGSAGAAGFADVRVRLGGFQDERLDEFHRAVREIAGWLGVTVGLHDRKTLLIET